MTEWVKKVSSKTNKPYFFNAATNKSFFTNDDLASLPTPWGFTWGPDKALLYVDLTTMKTQAEPPQGGGKKRKLDDAATSSSSSSSSGTVANAAVAYGIPAEVQGTATKQDTNAHHTHTEVDYIKRFTPLPVPVIGQPDEFTKQGITEKNMWNNLDLQVTETLRKTFKDYKVYDAQGVGVKFQAGVNPLEGMTLHNHIKRNNFRYCCEIGCAYGTSAQYMCQAFKDLGFTGGVGPNKAQLVSVDPYQDTQWKGIGALNVERAGLKEFHRVVQMKDFLALPMLLSEIVSGTRERYHMIFIDGMHLFDYTLLDFFYADLMLEVNGVIVVDDIKHPSVKKCMDYILTNYPHYRLVQTPCSSSAATFVKRFDDVIDGPPRCRRWNTHSDF